MSESRLHDEETAMRLDRQLCFPLYAAARKVTGLYTPVLRPFALTYTQYIVLLVLWEAGEIRMSALCSRLRLDSGTLTPVLKKLEASGYLVRTRLPGDERAVKVSLTEAGRRLQDACRSVPAQVGSCMPLSPEEAVTLYTLLYKVLGPEAE